MTTLISTENGELVNFDHIQVISATAVNSAGEQKLEAKVTAGSAGYQLIQGTPDEVQAFGRRLRHLLNAHGTKVIDCVEEARKLSNARLDEQERTTPQERRFDDGFFKEGEL